MKASFEGVKSCLKGKSSGLLFLNDTPNISAPLNHIFKICTLLSSKSEKSWKVNIKSRITCSRQKSSKWVHNLHIVLASQWLRMTNIEEVMKHDARDVSSIVWHCHFAISHGPILQFSLFQASGRTKWKCDPLTRPWRPHFPPFRWFFFLRIFNGTQFGRCFHYLAERIVHK